MNKSYVDLLNRRREIKLDMVGLKKLGIELSEDGKRVNLIK